MKFYVLLFRKPKSNTTALCKQATWCSEIHWINSRLYNMENFHDSDVGIWWHKEEILQALHHRGEHIKGWLADGTMRIEEIEI